MALVDRRGPGEETSHGNAGVIQSEAVEPYAMPRDLPTLARVALGLGNDVRWRFAALGDQIGPLARYWWNSERRRHSHLSTAHASLIRHAAAEHDLLVREAGAEALVRRAGFLVLHRRTDHMEKASAEAERLSTRWGVPHTPLDAQALRSLEPAIHGEICGGIHWTEPMSVVDPGGLVKAYAALFERSGGTRLAGDAATLRSTGSGWSVETSAGRIDADVAVVALGPWSPELLKPFGYRFAMVRKRGYHRHFAGGATLTRPVLDVDHGYVVAPMARGLRVCTGAELTGRNSPPTPVQLGRAERALRGLLDLGGSLDEMPWFGTRPFLAAMLPAIGEAPKHPGLWFDFGHGHQGFTLGPISGRLLAELMGGEDPIVDPLPFRPSAIVV